MSTKSPSVLPEQVKAAADARLTSAPRKGPAPSADPLLHELQVHRIELEMQNEALRQAQSDLEASRDRYLGLYDFAPVGYLTLSETGVIVEANLTAARLLGIERSDLPGRRFEHLLAGGERDRWLVLLASSRPQAQACEFSMRRADGATFHALLECRAKGDHGEQRETRVTFSDISERKRIEQALSRSEESFRRLAELSPTAIFRTDVAGACTYVNQRGAAYAGRTMEELLGYGWLRVVHPEDRAHTLAQWRRDMSARRPTPLEWRAQRPDGSVRRAVSETVAEHDEQGRVIGYISCIADITELRREEERRRAAHEEQRNALTRDVHHRIKNNLQGVAGLLRRELGSFVELQPILNAAISQVNAIAVVHGLQAAFPGETIRLCDSIRTICRVVEELAGRRVGFRIENEQTTFKPIQIESREAVPVALILNELIFNAVKHSPEGSRDPTVSLRADGRAAEVLIRNALASPPAFDFAGDNGLGTGLRLVRSLLPDPGAELAYECDAEDCLLARLRLTSPIVGAPAPQS